ncbi:hypothetical protein A3715_15365 [Oleiphilus sp. HI0009]|nr:hypothetical protein A3715_15365 [Oleiphilus sp. HI0009]
MVYNEVTFNKLINGDVLKPHKDNYLNLLESQLENKKNKNDLSVVCLIKGYVYNIISSEEVIEITVGKNKDFCQVVNKYSGKTERKFYNKFNYNALIRNIQKYQGVHLGGLFT